MNEESTPSGADFVPEWNSMTMEAKMDLFEAAKLSLPATYREDGPYLGCEFDSIPEQWLTSIHEGNIQSKGFDARNKSKRMVIGEYDAEAAEDGSIQDIRRRMTNTGSNKRCLKSIDASQEEESVNKSGKKLVDKSVKLEKEMERQMKKKERRLNKEKERLNKEKLKELEKQEREREKLLKVQQREEEKQKLQQERDQKKREREFEKERKAEERRKQQEEKKRERDLQKALAVQRKFAQKEIERQLEAGPPDDLDLEIETLKKQKTTDLDIYGYPLLPFFPPTSLPLLPAFPQYTESVSSDIMMTWSFLQSFCEIIGIHSFTVLQFIEALTSGQQSLLLCNIHIGLIRLIQADMEESHHLVLTQGSGGTSNFMDRAVVGISGTLDEALAWGFDVDAWRGHLNPYTWPEILRQLAISAGHGPKRFNEVKDRVVRTSNESEDALMEEKITFSGLKLPSRLSQGTVKAAAWSVLSEVGPEGLTIAEIATRIQKQGLRDLRTSKTPEATVAGALSRDAAFARVAPATYALQVIVSSSLGTSDPTYPLEPQQDQDVVMKEANGEAEDGGEIWIQSLTVGDYGFLSFERRLEVLKSLCDMALDSPTLRACLEARLEREIAEQKKLDVEARAEKRARREQATEETQRRLLEMDNTDGQLTTMQLDAVSENLDSIVKTIMTESLQDPVHCAAGSYSARIDESLASKAQNHVRFEPVGVDRRFNRYWRLCDKKEESLESVENCVYVEIEGVFKVVKTQESLNLLLEQLDRRGAREGSLYRVLSNFRLPYQVPESTSRIFKPEQSRGLRVPGVGLFARKWCGKDSSCCEDLLDRLKMDLLSVEGTIPIENKKDLDQARWRDRLQVAANLEDILGLLGELEQSLTTEVLHPNFRKQPVTFSAAWRQPYTSDSANGKTSTLSWLPPSFAAIYLRLCSLDASLRYFPGLLTGREVLLSYKYVQKPFVRDLNPHVDLSHLKQGQGEGTTTHVVSVEPISTGGSLIGSSFPVLQKGIPVRKRTIPFTLEIEKIRESVLAAERSGTLYAHMQVGRGKTHSRPNGVKSLNPSHTTKPMDEMEEGSPDYMDGSSEQQEIRENVAYYDEGSENSSGGFAMSQDGEDVDDDDDYRL